MATSNNPRKFSEKIALHNQKQAEETAAFEEVMKDLNITRAARVCGFTYGRLRRRATIRSSIKITGGQLPLGSQYSSGSFPDRSVGYRAFWNHTTV